MEPTERPGHESTDANMRAVALAGVGLAVVTALALGAVTLQLGLLERSAAERDRPPLPIATAVGPEEPPEPRLQTAPAKDLAAMRAEEDILLRSYGWVDRKGGIVHVPIEQAKKLVAEQPR